MIIKSMQHEKLVRYSRISMLYLSISFFVLRAIIDSNLSYFIAISIGLLLLVDATTKRISVFILVFIVCICAGYIINIVNNDFSQGWVLLPYVFSCLGVALTIYKCGISERFTKICFLFISTYFTYLFFVKGIPAEDIFKGSRNHVSVLFIMISAMYYFSKSIKSKPYSILPALITFLVSVICIGSSGIISSFILLVGVLLCLIKDKRKRWFALSGAVCIAIVVFINFELILNGLESWVGSKSLMDKMDGARLAYGDVRFLIWEKYIGSLDGLGILAGVPLGETFYGFTNLHSSYFLLHQRLGGIALVYVIMIFWSLYKLAREKKLIFMCFLAILLRAYSDTIIFTLGSYDWLVTCFLIYPMCTNSSLMTREKNAGGAIEAA